jgi:hypothetical protein
MEEIVLKKQKSQDEKIDLQELCDWCKVAIAVFGSNLLLRNGYANLKIKFLC